jgi:dTDP-glucose 4,6-dehydratase
MPTVTVRPFNTYGPRQSARAVIPTIVTQMLGRQDVRLGHLHPTRDFVFVSDTVDGLVRAATASAVEGLTVQLATGHETSIGDLAATIGRLMSRPNPVRSDEERRRPRTSEVDRLVGSYARADGKLSWRPTTALQDGLSQTIAWISAHRDRYRAGSYVL